MFNNTSPEPKESSIPTLRNSHKLIEKRLSFSFQKKKYGPGRGIKNILLLFAIVVLTWYGKQSSNNPFQPVHRIIVSGDNKNLSIYSYRKGSVLAILPVDAASPLPEMYPLPKYWNCISRTASLTNNLFAHPPQRWLVIDSSIPPLIDLPQGWPSPCSFEKKCINDCSIESLYSVHDHLNSIIVELSGIRIFIIDASKFIEGEASADTILRKEAGEILIILNADTTKAIHLRSALRPHFTIAWGNFKGAVQPYPNLVMCDSATTRQFVFKTKANKQVVLENPAG